VGGRTAAVVFVAVALVREPACGESGEHQGGVNAPCTREKDCAAGLSCTSGVCTSPDSGLPVFDAGSGEKDASKDALLE
jgi:hypothetical protein